MEPAVTGQLEVSHPVKITPVCFDVPYTVPGLIIYSPNNLTVAERGVSTLSC